jgi:hypothetical protein
MAITTKNKLKLSILVVFYNCHNVFLLVNKPGYKQMCFASDLALASCTILVLCSTLCIFLLSIYFITNYAFYVHTLSEHFDLSMFRCMVG